jgi:hypothetical protein
LKEGERERERCPEFLLLFLKGMTGALALFRYLVSYRSCEMLFDSAVSFQGREGAEAVGDGRDAVDAEGSRHRRNAAVAEVPFNLVRANFVIF